MGCAACVVFLSHGWIGLSGRNWLCVCAGVTGSFVSEQRNSLALTTQHLSANCILFPLPVRDTTLIRSLLFYLIGESLVQL